MPRFRTVRAFSAGGVVYRRQPQALQTPLSRAPNDLPARSNGPAPDDVESAPDDVEIVLVGRALENFWVLPKGTPREGESTAEVALREVEEETGIKGRIVGELGSIHYCGERHLSAGASAEDDSGTRALRGARRERDAGQRLDGAQVIGAVPAIFLAPARPLRPHVVLGQSRDAHAATSRSAYRKAYRRQHSTPAARSNSSALLAGWFPLRRSRADRRAASAESECAKIAYTCGFAGSERQ